jgi:Tol biopolymer transport system component
MTRFDDLDRALDAYLEREALPPPPAGLRDDVLEATARRRPRAGLVAMAHARLGSGVLSARPVGPALALVVIASIVLALFAFGLLAGGRPAPAPLGVVPPTSASASPSSQPGATPFPVLDGEPWIAYMSQIAGPNSDRVWLVRPDGSDRHQLVTGLDGQQEHPDWSPDGSLIAFDHWYTDQTRPGMDLIDVWVMSHDGSGARRVASCESPCDQLSYPSWSPDGSSLVVSRFDELSGTAWGPSAIEVVDVATGNRRVVWQSTDGSEAYHVPRWSPDGTRIVFTVETYTDATESTLMSTRLAIVKADGTSSEPVPITAPDRGAWGGDWSPDGTAIAFFSNFDPAAPQDRTTATDIYTVRPDGTGLRNVTNLGLGSERAIEPTWTSDGSGFVFTLVDGFGSGQIPAVALMDADGSNMQRLGFASGTAGRLRPTP